MAVEIDLENALPRMATLPDGRRAVVIEDVYQGADGPQALLILPRRDAWLALFKLERFAEKAAAEERAAERNEVWRGGQIIATADGR